MNTFFISDLHLDENHPEITECFLQFLATQAKTANALYILGDFFETWVGDDNDSPLITQIAEALKQLSASMPIYFIQGNRDFLLGKRFAKRCGMQLLPDPTVINLYGKPVLLMHGDLLCTDDVVYQKFRKKAHNRWLRALFLSLPLFLRRKIAIAARKRSQQYAKTINRTIQDVTQTAVENYLRAAGSQILIHGHTHLPAIHEFTLDGYAAKRIVLPAWHGSGGAVKYHATGELEFLNLPYM